MQNELWLHLSSGETDLQFTLQVTLATISTFITAMPHQLSLVLAVEAVADADDINYDAVDAAVDSIAIVLMGFLGLLHAVQVVDDVLFDILLEQEEAPLQFTCGKGLCIDNLSDTAALKMTAIDAINHLHVVEAAGTTHRSCISLINNNRCPHKCCCSIGNTVLCRNSSFAHHIVCCPRLSRGSRQPCSCVGSWRRHGHGCKLTKCWQLRRCRLPCPELENSRGGVVGLFFHRAGKNGCYHHPGVDSTGLSLWTGRNVCQNDRAEVVILQPRILCKEVACILIMTKPLIIGAGHTRSFDAVPLRESTKRPSWHTFLR
jgi:hypothetical protein